MNITPKSAKTQQHLSLERLWQESCFQGPELDSRAKATITKRLQRAREMAILADLFGTEILDAPPEVSVFRLDQLKISDLLSMKSGQCEVLRVRAILGRIKGGGTS